MIGNIYVGDGFWWHFGFWAYAGLTGLGAIWASVIIAVGPSRYRQWELDAPKRARARRVKRQVKRTIDRWNSTG